MMMKKKIKYPLIYLEWCDAIANSKWFGEKELDEWILESEWVIKEVGWVLRETKEYIVMAGRVDNDKEPQYGNLQKIPKTWIRKRRNITLNLK